MASKYALAEGLGLRTADAGSEKPLQPAARPSGAGLQRMSVASPVGRRQDLDAAENPSVKVLPAPLPRHYCSGVISNALRCMQGPCTAMAA